MKKLIVAMAIAFIGIGGTAVHAQSDPPPLPNTSVPLPAECAERSLPNGDRTVDIDLDGRPDVPATCVDFYVAQAPPTTAAPTTTTTVPVTVPPQQLPRTGSGVSPILGIGALLLVGGGIVVVASRRRSSATTS